MKFLPGRKHRAFIIKVNWLMLIREITTVYFEIQENT
jgi:hypothetical protein